MKKSNSLLLYTKKSNLIYYTHRQIVHSKKASKPVSDGVYIYKYLYNRKFFTTNIFLNTQYT